MVGLHPLLDWSGGLRQGCPLSMPLYVLTAETMACNIRQNPRIHGLRPPDSEAEVKFSQFADDTTLLLTDEQSIIETFNTLPVPRSTKESATVYGVAPSHGALISYSDLNGTMTLFPIRSLASILEMWIVPSENGKQKFRRLTISSPLCATES